MKICKDCKFLNDEYYCLSPNNGICMISGNPKARQAIMSRLSSTECGKDAIWFEEKEEIIPWYKFWKR